MIHLLILNHSINIYWACMCLVLLGAQTTKIKTNTIPTLWRLYTYSLRRQKIPPCIDHIVLLSSEQVHLLRRVKLRKSNKCKQIFRILILYQNVSLNFLNILFPPLWITIYYSTAFINNSFLNTKQLLIPPLSILTDAIYQGTYFPALFCILFGSFHPIILAAFSVDGDYSYNTPVLKFSKPLIYKGIYFYSTYKIQR